MRYGREMLQCSVLILLGALAGCQDLTNSSGIKEDVVKTCGKLTKGGQPLTVSNPNVGRVQISFIEVKQGPQPGETFSDSPKANGEFTIAGRLGNGLTRGKYRVAVRQWDPYPSVDKLQGKFDETNTPITIDIDGPTTDLNIDLDKYQKGS